MDPEIVADMAAYDSLPRIIRDLLKDNICSMRDRDLAVIYKIELSICRNEDEAVRQLLSVVRFFQ